MTMKKPITIVLVFLLFVCSSSFCVSFTEGQKRDYGVLESAITFSSDKVIGEYGCAIPDDFTAENFMRFIENKIPKDYYEALKKYQIELKPKSCYYLLLVFDPKSESLILFDYSCTPEIDGPVLLNPDKYDIRNLELYDKCN